MDFQAILAVESDAEALEKLHERDPEGFAQALPEALAASPESALLKEWAQRLVGEAEPHAPPPESDVPESDAAESDLPEPVEPQASQPDEPGDEAAVSAESLYTDQAAPVQDDPDTDDADQGIPSMELPSPEPVAPQALQEESKPAEPEPARPAKAPKPAKPKAPAKPRRILGPGDATLIDWLVLIGLVLLGGVGLSLLDPFAMFFEPSNLFARNNSLVGYALLTVLVLHWRGWPRTMSWAALGLFAAAAVYANLVPLPVGFEMYSPMAGFDNPVNLALLHLPMLMILVLGACYAKGGPLRIAGWKGFIRFYGEMSVYGMFLILGIVLFAAMGGMLFGQLRIDWDPHLLYLALFAVAALQLGGAWLALHHKGSTFAPTFARYLTPWTVLLLAGYLVATLFAGRVWIGREILAFLQFLTMVLVMGLSVYGVIDKAERPRRVGEAMLVLLLALALVSCWPVLHDLLGLVDHGMDALSLALLGGILALCLLFALQLLALLAKLVGLVSMGTVESVPVFWIPLVGLWWLFMALAMPWLF